MDLMGAQLRKISVKAGGVAAGFSVALSAGMALALQSQGRDPAQAFDAAVPLFVGALAVMAGVDSARATCRPCSPISDPARAPRLFILVMGGAAGCLALVRALVPPIA